jgi:hypothetical protein
VEEVGVERVHGRPIRLFQLAEWMWHDPDVDGPFTLFVAASTNSDRDVAAIGRFAAEAVASGCGFVCTWGEGCQRVHDLFDEAAISAGRFVMSSWHAEESLAEALYVTLVNSIPEQVTNAADSAAILAVEAPWIADVRRLVANQDELARLWVAEGE